MKNKPINRARAAWRTTLVLWISIASSCAVTLERLKYISGALRYTNPLRRARHLRSRDADKTLRCWWCCRALAYSETPFMVCHHFICAAKLLLPFLRASHHVHPPRIAHLQFWIKCRKRYIAHPVTLHTRSNFICFYKRMRGCTRLVVECVCGHVALVAIYR